MCPVFFFWVWPRFPHSLQVRRVAVACLNEMFGQEKSEEKREEAAGVATAPTPHPIQFLGSSRAGAADLPCVVLLSVAFIKRETAFY